jgi:recombination protein RecT
MMSTDLTNPPKQSKAMTLRSRLGSDDFKAAIAEILPKHITADRMARVATAALTKTQKLADCDQASFFNAMMTCSQLGLEPDGRLAHLIPYGTTCQLIIDYKGLVALAMRSGKVSNIHADKVCDKDEFVFNIGHIEQHKIDFAKPRGNAYAYYAIVTFKDGGKKCEVMSLDEIKAIQKRSRSGNSGPWQTDFDEMAKKTVFRRLSKWLELSPEYRDALEHDDKDFVDGRVTERQTASVSDVAAFLTQEPSDEPTDA